MKAETREGGMACYERSIRYCFFRLLFILHMVSQQQSFSIPRLPLSLRRRSNSCHFYDMRYNNNTIKVIYNPNARTLVTKTTRPLVLKYRPCPSMKNSSLLRDLLSAA